MKDRRQGDRFASEETAELSERITHHLERMSSSTDGARSSRS